MKKLLFALAITTLLPVGLNAQGAQKHRAVIRIAGQEARGNHWQSNKLYNTAGEARQAAAAKIVAGMKTGQYPPNAQGQYIAGSEPVR